MSRPSNVVPKTEIVGIQYLRGIAALLVLIVHSDHMLRQDKYFGYSYLGDFSNGGNLGVDLFFVISGFIMFHITDGFALTSEGWEFVRRRFIRIVPFMWLCIVAVYVLRSGVRGGIDPIPFVRAFFLWPVGDLDPNPVWTLRHELFFYLCTFLCIAFKRGYLALGAFLILPLPLLFLKSQFGILDHEIIQNFFNPQANTGFAMGAILGWVYRKQEKWHSQQLGNIAVLAAPVILFCFEYFVSPMWGSAENPESMAAWNRTMKSALTTLVCGCIVYGALSCVDSKNLLSHWGRVVGNASYSIYLTHEIIISFMGILFVKLKWLTMASTAGVLAIVSALVFGILVHYLIEKPLIRSLKKRF